MTIHALKALNEHNGGKFFSRENMKFMGDTMSNFSVRKNTLHTVLVTRKRAGKPHVPLSQWIFSTIDGRVIHSK